MDNYYELSMEQEVALNRASALADPERLRKTFRAEIRRESKEDLAIWLEEILSLESMADYLQDNQL